MMLSAPGAPVNLAAAASPTSVSLSWNTSTGEATQFDIYVSQDQYQFPSTPQYTTANTSFIYYPDPVTNGTTYYFEVTAANDVTQANPEGDQSAPTDCSATPEQLPAMPTGLQATPGRGSVTLTWSAGSTAGGAGPVEFYDIYRGTASGGESIYDTSSGTSYTDPSATPGTQYFYEVTAANDYGQSSPSNEASTTPEALPLYSQINDATFDSGTGVFTVNWIDTNEGNGAITAPYTDDVLLYDTVANTQLVPGRIGFNDAEVQVTPPTGGIPANGGIEFESFTLNLYSVLEGTYDVTPRNTDYQDQMGVAVLTDGGNYSSVNSSVTAIYGNGNLPKLPAGQPLYPVGGGYQETPTLAAESITPSLDLTTGVVTVNWYDFNSGLGTEPMNKQWNDQVELLDTGPNGASTPVVLDTVAPPTVTDGDSPLGSGDSLTDPESVTFNSLNSYSTFTPGDQLEVIVTTDGNSASPVSLSAPASAAGYQMPDLVPQSVSAGLDADGVITVNWDDANLGGAASAATGTDLVTLTDATQNPNAPIAQIYQPLGSGVPAAGVASQTAQFSPSDYLSGSYPSVPSGDQLQVAVYTNVYNPVESPGSSEPYVDEIDYQNNSSPPADVAPPPLSDLVPTDISASVAPTGMVTVTWQDVNDGVGPVGAQQKFVDQVTLFDATANNGSGLPVGNPEEYSIDGPIAADGGVTPIQTATFTLSNYQGIQSGDQFQVDVYTNVYNPVESPDSTYPLYILESNYSNNDSGRVNAIPSTVVINTNDSGSGSLRQAIANAQSIGGDQTVTFDPADFATPQTITLTSGLLELSSGVTIQGLQDPSGNNLITVSGGSTGGVGGSEVFQVDSGVTASISDLTITDGQNDSSNGGGIDNSGTLTVTNSMFSQDSASSGGGISNSGMLTIEDCTFADDSAGVPGVAAGTGGGIFNDGTLTVTNSTFSNDSAASGGGVDGTGGGIFSGGGGTLTMTNSTLTANEADTGGGIDVEPTSGNVTLYNTIVAGNTGSDGVTPSDIAGSLDSNPQGLTASSNNLLGSGGYGGATALNNNIVLAQNEAAGLGTLADNGGPTQTIALLMGSPALAVGSVPLAGAAGDYDQRGPGYERIADDTVDIGAYQVQPLSIIVTNTNDFGDGSLRQAIADAQSIGGDQTVTFDPADFAAAQTIKLTSGLIELDGDLTIQGLQSNGSNLITVSGSDASTIFQVDAGVTASINDLTVADGNESNAGSDGGGGGIDNAGSLTVTDCTISDDKVGFGFGGGIYNTGALTVSGCTFSNDTADEGGGGIYNSGTLTLTDSTLAGNQSGSSFGFGGGGIRNAGGTATITNATLSDNDTGLAVSGGDVTLYNTIVAGNDSSGDSNDISGTVDSNSSNNLIGDGGAGGLTDNDANHDIVLNFTQAADLASSLANNGGPTQTIALLPGSPAINAGSYDQAQLAGLTTDQRGMGYDRSIDNSSVDIGAYQIQPGVPTQLVYNDLLPIVASGNSAAVNVSVEDPYGNPVPDSSTVSVTLTGPPGGSFAGTWTSSPANNTGGTATFTTPVLDTAGSYSLTATDNDDALPAASDSFIVSTTVVTNTNDSGTGSLRQAIANAENLGGNQTVTFQPGLTGPITITGAPVELSIQPNNNAPPVVTIQGPGADLLSIDANTQVLLVDSGVTAYVSGLTLADATDGAISDNGTLSVTDCTFSGDSAGDGGGVDNTGMLTVNGCTFSNDTADEGGGGIYNSGTLTINNSTFENNQAGSGGGIDNDTSGTLTATNCTFSGNEGIGGGIFVWPSGDVTLYNTIVAGNTLADGSTASDISGALEPNSSYNLFGTGGAGGLTGGPGNQFGVADAGLETLAANGGQTDTMALVSDSPALQVGSVAQANAAGLTTDQRGTGYARIVDGLVDIGAYETQPTPPPPPPAAPPPPPLIPGATQLVFTQVPVETAASPALVTTPVIVEVEDSTGDQIPSDAADVSLTITGPGLGADGQTLSPTVSNGDATFDLSGAVNPETAGTYTLSAADTTASLSASSSFTIDPDGAIALVVSPIDNMNAGGTVASAGQPVTVQIEDQYGNVVTGDGNNVTVSLAGAAGQTLGGTATVGAWQGVATFSDLSVAGPAGAEDQLQFSDAGDSLTQTSNSFQVTDASQQPDPGNLINVDFTADSPVQSGAAVIGSSGDQWNDVSLPDFALYQPPLSATDLPLFDSSGDSTPVTLSYSNVSLATSFSGGSPTFASTPDANLMDGYLIASSTSNGGAGPATVTFDNLDPAATYTIYLYSGANADGRETDFTVNGQPASATFDGSNPAFEAGNNYVSFTTQPTNGSIDIGVSSATEGDLNGIQLFQATQPVATITALAKNTTAPITFGQSVTFTAMIASLTPAAGTPTGTVTFEDGATTLGTATLANGIATLTTTMIPPGVNLVDAVYGGDANFNPSTSGSLKQTVYQAATNITLAKNTTAAIAFGQSVTFTATVVPVGLGAGDPTGTVTFMAGATPLGTVTLTNGVATLITTTIPAGVNEINAVYSGDANFTKSTSGSLKQTVYQAATNITLTKNTTAAITFGQSVTFTATVVPVSLGAGDPTGTVTFMAGATLLGTVTLTNGVATLITTTIPAGVNAINAVYNGDANFTRSTSGSLKQTVYQAATTTTLTKNTTAPLTFGQSVTFTATIASLNPGAGAPAGTVTFMAGTTALGTAMLVDGIATLTTTTIPPGGNEINAVYSGDANFTTSTSGSLKQTVYQAATTTTLTKNTSAAITFGQSVTFTATVVSPSPGAGAPTGTVTFMAGTTALGTATLVDGIATLTTTTIPPGVNEINAVYGGDANFTTSTSGSLKQTVYQAATTLKLTKNTTAPITIGKSVTLTATLDIVVPGAGMPTGTVTFMDNGSSIGTGTLTAGVATLITTALPVGSNSITAVYGGNTDYSTGTSSALTQTVHS